VNNAFIRNSILSGELGNVELIQSMIKEPGFSSREFMSASGGIFRDVNVHDFDLQRFIAGCEPKRVYALGRNLFSDVAKEFKVFDTNTITLEFESGAIGNITTSMRCTFGYDMRIEVHGSNKTYKHENIGPNNVEYWDETGRHKTNAHRHF